MDPDRRDLLKLLGVLGVGGGASALYLDRQSDGEPESEPADSSPSSEQGRDPAETYETAVRQVDDEYLQTAPPPEAYAFDYEPIDLQFEDQWLERFVATPVEGGDGDRITAWPGTRSVTAMATTFRRWLGVPDEQWGEATLNDQSVTLYGGSYRDRLAVFGTLESPALMIGARATDEATLEDIVTAWSLDSE